MGLETGNTIADLEDAWPLDGDFIDQGDDHIRLIKNVLKTVFPGFNGDGFNKPISATEDELNFVDGVTAPIQDQIDAITAGTGEFPVGTVMLFRQASAPPGWVKLETAANSMVRNVATSGGGFGGSDSPISLNYSHNHTTSDLTLQLDHLPAQLDTFLQLNMSQSSQSDDHSRVNSVARGNTDGPVFSSGPIRINNFIGSQPHNHGNTSISGGTWTPLYVNVISCQRFG